MVMFVSGVVSVDAKDKIHIWKNLLQQELMLSSALIALQKLDVAGLCNGLRSVVEETDQLYKQKN